MQFTVSSTHPSLPGHFPGRPVVPGVVLLSHLFELVEAHDCCRVVGIRRLKFLHPVLPEQTLHLEIVDRRPDSRVVKCWFGSVLVVDGQLAVG